MVFTNRLQNYYFFLTYASVRVFFSLFFTFSFFLDSFAGLNPTYPFIAKCKQKKGLP